MLKKATKNKQDKGLGATLVFLGGILILAGIIYYFTPDQYTAPIDEIFIFYDSDELTDEEMTGSVETDFNLENGTATPSTSSSL